MDMLERLGAVACRDDQGQRRRRMAHLARQVEEVYYKAKRDDRSTSLTASQRRLESELPRRLSRPRAP